MKSIVKGILSALIVCFAATAQNDNAQVPPRQNAHLNLEESLIVVDTTEMFRRAVAFVNRKDGTFMVAWGVADIFVSIATGTFLLGSGIGEDKDWTVTHTAGMISVSVNLIHGISQTRTGIRKRMLARYYDDGVYQGKRPAVESY